MIEVYNEDFMDFAGKLDGKKIAAIITDPPYDFTTPIKNKYHSIFNSLTTGARIVFSPPENLWQEKCDQTLFWIKPISTKNTSKSYSRFVEVIQVWNGKTWNTGRHWSQYTNVFTDLVDNNSFHAYTKPLSMMIRLVLNHTNPGDTVLDPFMGSGTTGLACLQTGRNFIGVEIDPGYCEIAEGRIKP